MNYCYQCGRITAGEPLFCNFCGRSYDVKLCPRLHANPRIADVCSQCGSRELSTPQPKVSLAWQAFAFFVKVALGGFLAYVSVAVLVELLTELLTEPRVQNALIALGLLLVGPWFLWSMLPDWFRRAVHYAVHSPKDKERGHGRR